MNVIILLFFLLIHLDGSNGKRFKKEIRPERGN